MITITNIRHAEDAPYDEIWAIVRSLKSKSNKLKQVTELSPSLDLFFKYQNLKKSNQWNANTFQSIYVPQFLSELKHGKEHGFEMLNELYRLDKAGKNITLVCFCPDETMCHRSIIAGLLQGIGCNVKTSTNNDYSKYFDMYSQL